MVHARPQLSRDPLGGGERALRISDTEPIASPDKNLPTGQLIERYDRGGVSELERSLLLDELRGRSDEDAREFVALLERSAQFKREAKREEQRSNAPLAFSTPDTDFFEALPAVYALVGLVVFLGTWALCWHTYGSMGLFLGWMPAAICGVLWLPLLILALVLALLAVLVFAVLAAFSLSARAAA